MFERMRIRREFNRIVTSLQGSELFSVDRNIYEFFQGNEHMYADMMRTNGWTAFGTCIFMISHVCDFLARTGKLPELRRENKEIYESLMDLYGFAVMATGKRPDAHASFFMPEGEPPFRLDSE